MLAPRAQVADAPAGPQVRPADRCAELVIMAALAHKGWHVDIAEGDAADWGSNDDEEASEVCVNNF